VRKKPESVRGPRKYRWSTSCDDGGGIDVGLKERHCPAGDDHPGREGTDARWQELAVKAGLVEDVADDRREQALPECGQEISVGRHDAPEQASINLKG